MSYSDNRTLNPTDDLRDFKGSFECSFLQSAGFESDLLVQFNISMRGTEPWAQYLEAWIGRLCHLASGGVELFGFEAEGGP